MALLAAHVCHSHVLWAEETLPLAAAREILFGKTLYRSVWFDKPPLVPLVYLLWGVRIGFVLRFSGAVYCFACCVVAWLFARSAWGRQEAFWAAGLLGFVLTFDVPSAVLPLAADLLLLLPHLAAVYLAVPKIAVLERCLRWICLSDQRERRFRFGSLRAFRLAVTSPADRWLRFATCLRGHCLGCKWGLARLSRPGLDLAFHLCRKFPSSEPCRERRVAHLELDGLPLSAVRRRALCPVPPSHGAALEVDCMARSVLRRSHPRNALLPALLLPTAACACLAQRAGALQKCRHAPDGPS